MREDGNARIVAIGDLHADLPPLRRFLLAHGLAAPGHPDDPLGTGELDWTGGDAILVQTGDIPDRGPDTLAIAATLARLRGQGARIFTLVGNHDIPYLLTPDTAEQFRRIRQALPYMIDEQGRVSAYLAEPAEEYQRQAEAITALHRHPDGGLVAVRLGDTLFMHAEPGPDSFTDADLTTLAETGRLKLDPARHVVDHVVFWGRAYSCGSADWEGGYQPAHRELIPAARGYDPNMLELHEAEPAVIELYSRLRDMGVSTVVHGHVPASAPRRYTVCGVWHDNIDEAICGHYRVLFTGALDPEWVPRGWTREATA